MVGGWIGVGPLTPLPPLMLFVLETRMLYVICYMLYVILLYVICYMFYIVCFFLLCYLLCSFINMYMIYFHLNSCLLQVLCINGLRWVARTILKSWYGSKFNIVLS